MAQIQVGSVANSLRLEGATRVWAEVNAGLNNKEDLDLGVLALHGAIEGDGGIVEFEENQYNHLLAADGVPVGVLDHRVDEVGRIPTYTEQEVERIAEFTIGKQVLTALEPITLELLSVLDPSPLPGLLLNTYRTADNRTERELQGILDSNPNRTTNV